ncbi:MAG TPA: choice-of-anchor H family protein [Gammaproteobacteria bacterium]|jgi:hypothetical protein|nr:choice-of-anchor H family protein [Gammaproteobacteria bacterium]
MNAALLPSLAFAAVALTANAAAPDTDDTEERVTRSSEGRVADHAADELRDPKGFSTTRRATTDIAEKPRSASGTAFNTTKSTYGDTYVYDATTDLFYDNDNDGYFHHLRVRFDADSVFARADVYAEIYISADGNAWEHLYTTSDFAVWGTDPTDDYEVETDLVSGYSTGLYDVLIELHDAADGTLLDEYGPNESPQFSLRPLEDSTRDGAAGPPPDHGGHGGGGAMGWLALPALLAALAVKRRHRKSPP